MKIRSTAPAVLPLGVVALMTQGCGAPVTPTPEAQASAPAMHPPTRLVQAPRTENPTTGRTGATSVRVEKTAAGWRLLRAGQPFFIKGVGGKSELERLKALGANSIRTWGVEDLEKTLPAAAQAGLTVCAGIWLAHPRHGFDYNDAAAVARQKETVRAAVLKYKNDPALLLWGVGNEMEGDGKDPLVWKAVNDIARMIHEIDPGHPTMTVIAELGEGANKAAAFKRYCPDVDILGVNAYGGMGSLGKRLLEQEVDKPFVVTEWGPLGFWEGGYAPWGAPIEMTSTQKAEFAINNYHSTVEGFPESCLGSYAFLWGHKQERTSTWFGMLLPDGSRVALVDELQHAWTGQWPKNRVPRLLSMKSDIENKTVPPATRYTVSVAVSDPENDPLQVAWEVREETTATSGGGDAEAEPAARPECIVEAKGKQVTLKTPEKEGAYRLFVFIRDNHGGAATANLPFFVKK